MYNDEKYYIKTGVNGKNGIFQFTSGSRRAAFETSIRQMVAPFCIILFCKVCGGAACGVASNCLQEEGPSYPRGPSCPRLCRTLNKPMISLCCVIWIMCEWQSCYILLTIVE